VRKTTIIGLVAVSLAFSCVQTEASCAEKQKTLISQLQQSERDALANGQRAARVQQSTNNLIYRFNQAIARRDQIGFALNNINAEGAMLSNNLSIIRQNLQSLTPFNDPNSFAIKQNLRFQAQNIEIRITQLNFARTNARADMNALNTIASMIDKDIRDNFSALNDMAETSRKLFQVRIDSSNKYTYFNTPEGRQECTEAELAEVQAQYEQAEASLADIAKIGEEQKALHARQTQLNDDLKAFIDSLDDA